MADSLTLINKRDDKINVFVVPVGMIPIANAGDPDKKYLWSFHTERAMDVGLYEAIMLSATDKLVAYKLFIEQLRHDSDKSYYYEGVLWHATCEGEDNYPNREFPILIASKATN